MNKEQFSALYPQLASHIQDRWNRLTADDLRQIEGRYDLLIGKIQEKYGVSREEIEEQFRNWRPNLKFDNERRDLYATKREVREEEEGSSIGKWLVAAGIPALLLLGYFGTNYHTNDVKTTPAPVSPGTTQTLYTKVPVQGDVDTSISENARKILLANPLLLNDLKDLRIDTTAGVVTISGSVKTEEEKSLINALIERLAGVTKINNKVEVIK